MNFPFPSQLTIQRWYFEVASDQLWTYKKMSSRYRVQTHVCKYNYICLLKQRVQWHVCLSCPSWYMLLLRSELQGADQNRWYILNSNFPSNPSSVRCSVSLAIFTKAKWIFEYHFGAGSGIAVVNANQSISGDFDTNDKFSHSIQLATWWYYDAVEGFKGLQPWIINQLGVAKEYVWFT